MSIHSTRLCLAALFAVSLFLPTLASGQALLLRGNDPVRVALSDTSLDATIEKVVAGPDANERANGLRTAIPDRTALLGVHFADGRATITLGKRLLLLVRRDAELELALEQLNKSTINAAPGVHTIQILVEQLDGTIRTLEDTLEGAIPSFRAPDAPLATSAQFGTGSGPGIPGALSGKVIAISPGHGYYWHSTLGWTTQRGNIGGLIEDIHTNEIAMRYLIPYLENMGAAVISCRERGEVPVESIGDDDAGAPVFTETSAWSVSGSAGYNGGQYRFVSTATTATTSVTWQVPVARDGLHPVYVAYRASANRTTDAQFEVHHSGGVEVVSIDQTRDSLTWVPLGTYHFEVADGARITLSNRSTELSRVVIADAVRVGAGVGSIPRGAGTSGRPRWQESSRYWAQFNGAPSSVWDSIGSGQDNDDDVTCRPRFAEWRGADAFVSLHTNAGGGAGTSSFIYNGGATAGSSALQTAIHNQIVQDVRASYAPGWTDRGRLTANFGEMRLLNSMPGVLVELAFHDTDGSLDHNALHDPVFRRIGGRAMARGVLRYFFPSATFAPEPPVLLSVVQDGAAGLRVSWAGTAGATSYTVEASDNGKGFTEVARVTGLNWSTGPLPPHSMRSFRVRAWNATGRSFPGEVLTAGTAHDGPPHASAAELLLVQGFDRLDRNVKGPENTFDYLARHGEAIRRSGEFSLAFDAASNDAVRIGLVPLANYRAVNWVLGEESTQHETFDTVEQARVTAYLSAGGRLLVSGAEVGWDLEAQGTPGDLAFYRTQLGADYVADDANTYAFRGRANGIFADVLTTTFDDGAQGTYNVDWPDVIAPADANSTLCMDYGNGLGAGIQRIVGDSRVVYLGFPLETIVSPDVRAMVMTRALRFLLAGRELEVPRNVGLGQTAPITVRMPTWSGQVYALAASFGTGPIPMPNGQLLALDPDPLFSATLGQSSSVFMGFGGNLDAQGTANASFAMPIDPTLLGLELVVSGLTVQSTPNFAFGDTLPWYRIRVM